MEWLVVALFGGLVGLDATGFPQVMLSRPLVAATATGMLLGRPLEALTIAVVLEAFALVVLPVGASRYPENGTAAVAATAAYVSLPVALGGAGALLLTIVFALLWERAGGTSVTAMRRFNERLVLAGAPAVRATSVERRHLLALAADFARAGAVAVTGALVGGMILRLAAPLWGLGAETTFGALGVAASAMLAAVLPLFGGFRQRRAAFGLGLLCGGIVLLVVQ